MIHLHGTGKGISERRMTVTAKLLSVFIVDQQLRGLKSRLQGAERYLAEQTRLVGELEKKSAAIAAMLRQLEATAHNDEVEAAGMDERIASLRERMNTAKTSKEHAALLTETSTVKAEKRLVEDRALDSMTKLETLRAEAESAQTELEERRKVMRVAEGDRSARAAEIKDRVAELEAQRKTAAAEVPKSALAAYEERLALGVDDVMAPVEEQDRRNMEYTCGACYTLLPIENVSILLKRGDLTTCSSCDAILYMAAELREDITTAQDKKRKKSSAGVES